MKGRLPVGPFDTCVRTPIAFDLALTNSRVTSVEPRDETGRLEVGNGFRGFDPLTGLKLAERICCRSSLAHAFAYCQALEEANGLEVDGDSSGCRVILAEYERIAGHLGVLSDIGRSLGDGIVSGGPGRYVSRIRDSFSAVAGNRFGFGVLVPGGVRLDGGGQALDRLSDLLGPLERDSGFWLKKLMLSKRRLGDARLRMADVPEGYAPSPVLRASGDGRDTRSGETAYGAYRELSYRPVARSEGRTVDRLLVLFEEIRSSIRLIREVNANAGEPRIAGEVRFGEGSGVGACESPEGAVEHRVVIGPEGRLTSDTITCAARATADIAPRAIAGVRYEDVVPAILSFYLCAACADGGST